MTGIENPGRISDAGYGSFSQSDRIHHSLQNTRVVIAGGGPAGLFAAISLHKLGVRHITVLERTLYDAPFDVQRSYVFALGQRGRRAISGIPGLLEHLLQSSSAPEGYLQCTIQANEDMYSTARTVDMSKVMKNFTPGTIFFRPTYMKSLAKFVRERCSDVDIVQGATIEHVQFSGEDGGISKVHYRRSYETEMERIDANLLIACDGKTSVVVKALQQADETIVRSPYGFGARYTKSHTHGWKGRSLIAGKNIFAHVEGIPENVTSKCMTIVKGVNCTWIIGPMLDEDIEALDGLLVFLAAPGDDAVWQLQSVEQAYIFFEKAFPCINVREHITKESICSFVNGRNVEYPMITLRHSMGAKVGKAGGVVVIGDAAHAVPPDLGQGLNSSVEDVTVLAATATAAEIVGRHSTTWGDIAYQFHDNRVSDIKCMTEICGFSLMSKVSKFKRAFMQVDVLVRNVLSERLPALFDPPFFVPLSSSRPYSEVRRSQKYMTWKIILLAIIIILLLITAVTFLMKT